MDPTLLDHILGANSHSKKLLTILNEKGMIEDSNFEKLFEFGRKRKRNMTKGTTTVTHVVGDQIVGGHSEGSISPPGKAPSGQSKPSGTWIDIQGVSPEDMSTLGGLFDIHPLTADNCLSESANVQSEIFDDNGYLVVNLNVITSKPTDMRIETATLICIVYSDVILSFHSKPLAIIKDAANKLQKRKDLRTFPPPSWILYILMDLCANTFADFAHLLEDEVNSIDDRVLESANSDMLQQIKRTRTRLLQIRRLLIPTRAFYDNMMKQEEILTYVPESTLIYLRDVREHIVQSLEGVDIARELLTSAQSNYLAIIGNKTNLVMKSLAIISAVIMPLTLVAGLFGMNVPVPFQVSATYTSLSPFYTIAGLMIVVVAAGLAHQGWAWYKTTREDDTFAKRQRIEKPPQEKKSRRRATSEVIPLDP